VATRLGAQGVTVVLVGRTDDDAAAAAQLVRQLHPHADVRPLSCDLASLSDVQLLARRIRDLGLPLHLLVTSSAERRSTALGLQGSSPRDRRLSMRAWL
jgi:NAD(P)-dependent dehydrogenase (short-subunit alcohol dehydrogenase family)